ncbi:MAG: hypothetical protein Q8N51_00745 [Gammaproteobacteria bacterium]|nr:hypothetical protein [Gammaproteobacteria bacterium]
MAEMYQRELSGTLLDAYWLALRTWSLDDFEAAAGHLMGANTFMPRPSDFNALRKAGRETAAEAWVRVVQQSPRWRQGESGDADPLIDACIRAVGGNERIAMTDTAELHWMEKRFTEAYEELRDAREHREALPQITSPEAAKALSGSLKRIAGGVR